MGVVKAEENSFSPNVVEITNDISKPIEVIGEENDKGLVNDGSDIVVDDCNSEKELVNISDENIEKTLEVIVINQDGERMEGAEVFFQSNSASTDKDGVAIFSDVEFGENLIKVYAYGYKKTVTTVYIPKGNTEKSEFCIVLNKESTDVEEQMLISPEEFELSEKANYYLDLFNNNESGFEKTELSTVNAEYQEGTSFIECNGSIYYFASDGTYRYDIEKDEWDTNVYAPLPNWRNYSGIVAVGEKIYIIGGKQGEVYTNFVDVFDVPNGVWEQASDMPGVGAYFNAHYINGNIYVCGGITEGNSLYEGDEKYSGYVFYEYTPKDNVWKNKINSLTPNLSGAVSAVCGDTIYLTGFFGYYNEYTNVTRTYNVQSGKWGYAQSRPFASSDGIGMFGGIFVNIDGCLYYQGGVSYPTDTDDYTSEDMPYIYIPGTDEWICISETEAMEDFKLRANLYEPICVYNGRLYKACYENESVYFLRYDILNEAEYNFKEKTITQGVDFSAYIDDGSIMIKGDNTYGQLGTGNNDNSSEFIKIDGPWSEKKITNISARGYTVYAISEDNVLYAWGRNDKGQIGDGSTENRNYPVKVSENVYDVSAGKEHVVAIIGDSSYAWGSNEYKQIDDESTKDIFSTPKRLTKSTEIAAGDYHTIVNITDSDGIYAIGKNDRGQLGVENTKNFLLKNNVGNIDMIAAGSEHSSMLMDGIQYLTGDNSYGQLGSGLSEDLAYSDNFINTNRSAERIYANNNLTEYISNGRVYRTGKEYMKCYYDFDEIVNTNNISELSIGNNYTLGVDGYGDIWRWGVMTDDKNFDYEKKSFYTPLLTGYKKGIKSIDSRRTQVLAVNDSNELISWGKGYYGDGTDKEALHYYPTKIELNYGAVPSMAVRGKNFNLVVDKDGGVWGFGSNTNNPMGELGGKVRVPTRLSGIENVKMVAAGDGFSIFLKNDETLWGMGLNSLGQLGLGNTENVSQPTQIGEKDDYVKVEAGDNFVIALSYEGAYAFGLNDNGQLGIGTYENALTPQKIEVDFEDTYEKFVDVSVSTNYCLALTNKGNVYSWGRNGSGQLGLGNKQSQCKPQKITSLSDIVYIDAENVQSFAIKSDGTVYGWGHGANGQLAHENTGTCQIPREIESLKDKDISSVVCGDGYGIAISDNDLYSFGTNENGCLAIYSEAAQEYVSDELIALEYLKRYMKNIGSIVTDDIILPTSTSNGVSILWQSEKSEYITDDGIVSRPKSYSNDVDVVLTAKILSNASYKDDIIKNFYMKVLKSDGEDVPEIPERVKQNTCETSEGSNGSEYIFEETDEEGNEGEAEIASYFTSSNICVENKEYKNQITEILIPLQSRSGEKLTGVISNEDNNSWGVNILPNDAMSGWCTTSEVIEPKGADDPFYNKNVWVTNKVVNDNSNLLLYPMDDTVGNFKLSYFTTNPDKYEPNQWEIEAGMSLDERKLWADTDNLLDISGVLDAINSESYKRYQGKAIEFEKNIGGRGNLATKIIGLSFDSYADLDIYAVDVKKGDKITMCVEMEGADNPDNYIIGIANNIRDLEYSEDELCRSICYTEDFYYCQSFQFFNTETNKQTKYATWISNCSGKCYIKLGRTGIMGQKEILCHTI